jgi:DNA-binding NarL/FixJ family response regulator
LKNEIAEMITIAVTDDNEMLRKNIMERLKGNFDIIHETSSAKTLLRYLHAHPFPQHPQVVLMDIGMEEMDGIEATARVKELNPVIKVIMLTVFEDDEKVLSAIKAGADGYLIKDEKKERIIECIQDVMNGGSYLSPSVAVKAMKYLQKVYHPKEVAPGNPLSKRELEILQLIIKGSTYLEIAANLFISMATVKSHIYHIYEKLNVRNKMDAARKASGNHWV